MLAPFHSHFPSLCSGGQSGLALELPLPFDYLCVSPKLSLVHKTVVCQWPAPPCPSSPALLTPSCPAASPELMPQLCVQISPSCPSVPTVLCVCSVVLPLLTHVVFVCCLSFVFQGQSDIVFLSVFHMMLSVVLCR